MKNKKSNYNFIKNIGNRENVSLIQDSTTGTFYVQKVLSQYDKNIFSHPVKCIPKLFSVKQEDENLIVIEEYITGISLNDYINEHKSDTKFFFTLLYSLCDILTSLHNAPTPIIHRDIKPENIIIDEHNTVYLLDLNAAKFYSATDSRDTVLLGTVGYAAPEQYGFATSSPATDVYAIGSLIKNLLPLYESESLNKKFKSIIEKCCKMDSQDRYKTAKELKRDIYNHEHNYRLLAIPGFRSRNVENVIISSITYIFLIYYCFIRNYYNSRKLNILSFIIILTAIFTYFNYLGIHRLMPLTKSKNIIIKTIGKILITLIMTTIMSVICIFIYLH